MPKLCAANIASSNVIQYMRVWINIKCGKWSHVRIHKRYKVKHRDRSVHAILHYLLDNKCCEGIRYLLSNIKFMRNVPMPMPMCACVCARARFSIYSIHSFVCLLFFFFSLNVFDKWPFCNWKYTGVCKLKVAETICFPSHTKKSIDFWLLARY